MSSRRPREVYSTAVPWQTEAMPERERRRDWRTTPSMLEPRATGERDGGGSVGAAFSLPSYDTNASTTVASPPPGAAIVPEPSDCCG